MSSGRVLDGEAIEEPLAEGDPDPGAAADVAEPTVRALPQRRTSAELTSWRGEVRAIAVVAAGGIAAGAATVAAVSAAKAISGSRNRRPLRRGRGDRDVIASRSFLVDVHHLGR
jgi:hypothetical protein